MKNLISEVLRILLTVIFFLTFIYIYIKAFIAEKEKFKKYDILYAYI